MQASVLAAGITFSAGDNIGASPFASKLLDDTPTLEILNRMNLQVSALGNHELDQGLTDLETRILPASNFPILAANVSGSTPLSAEGGGKGTFIKEVGGVRVGFVGVVTKRGRSRYHVRGRGMVLTVPFDDVEAA